MHNHGVLTEAIQKVAKSNPELVPIDVSKIKKVEYFDGVVTYWAGHQHWSFNIFNHDFAKALWAEGSRFKPIVGHPAPHTSYGKAHFVGDNCMTDQLTWQYHLQMMVISDDPIKYLGDNL